MHGAAVMQSVVKTIRASMENAEASRVTNAQLALGTSGHFTEEAVRLYFQALVRDKPIEGTILTRSWLPAACLASIALRAPHRRRHALDAAVRVLEVSHQDACYIETIDVVASDE